MADPNNSAAAAAMYRQRLAAQRAQQNQDPGRGAVARPRHAQEVAARQVRAAQQQSQVVERATATSSEDGLGGAARLVAGVCLAIALSAIFVLPAELKVFWGAGIALTVLMALGFMLYSEWLNLGKQGGENAKYAEWGGILLYALTMLFSAVMAGILIFMGWSIYSITNTRTNLTTVQRAAAADGAADPDALSQDALEAALEEPRKRRKKKRRGTAGL